GQAGDLLTQVIFELRGVHGMDRLPAAEIAPPLVDLFLERHRGTWSRHRSGALRQRREPWVADDDRLQGPDPPHRRVHRLPLPALLRELGPSTGRDAVVLAA